MLVKCVINCVAKVSSCKSLTIENKSSSLRSCASSHNHCGGSIHSIGDAIFLVGAYAQMFSWPGTCCLYHHSVVLPCLDYGSSIAET